MQMKRFWLAMAKIRFMEMKATILFMEKEETINFQAEPVMILSMVVQERIIYMAIMVMIH